MKEDEEEDVKKVPNSIIARVMKSHQDPFSEFFCKICTQGFRLNESLNAHMHFDHKSFSTCSNCFEEFKDSSSLSRHRKIKHGGTKNQRSIRPPTDGPSDSLFQMYLIRRIHKISGKITYKCKECDEVYTTYKVLKTHVAQVHLKIKAFGCSLCPSSFRRLVDSHSIQFKFHKEI